MAQGELFQHEDAIVRAALAQLTPRERQVLRGLVAGLCNDAIAEELCVELGNSSQSRSQDLEKAPRLVLDSTLLFW